MPRQQQNKKDNLIRVSASQIKTKTRCFRRWGFQKINKLQEPTTAKQQFGTDCHEHMENWIGKSIPPPDTETGHVAKQLIRSDYLPAPCPELKPWVEKYLEISMSHIHPRAMLIGYSDLIIPPTIFGSPVVIDYKFTSNLRWAMSAKELAIDPQPLIYAKWAMDQFKTDKATARFLYGVASSPKTGPRKPTGSRKVEVEFKSDDLVFRKAWWDVEKDVESIVQAKMNVSDARELPANPDACNDYGQLCPFYDQCKPERKSLASIVSTSKVLQQNGDCAKFDETTKGPSMSLLDKIKKKKELQKAAEAPDAGMSVRMDFERLEAPATGMGMGLERLCPEVEVVAEAPKGTLLDRLKSMAAEEGVNPAPVSKTMKALRAEYQEKTGTRAPTAWKKAEIITALADGTVTDAGGGVIPEASPPPKSTESAPKPTESAPKPTESAPKPTESAPRATAAQVETKIEDVVEKLVGTMETIAKKVEENKNPTGPGLMVLFDCMLRKGPDGQKIENLSDWLKEVADKVAKDNNVPHFALIDYAQGAPALAGALELALTENPTSGVVIVDSDSLEGRAVKDVLIRHASIVIQGVR